MNATFPSSCPRDHFHSGRYFVSCVVPEDIALEESALWNCPCDGGGAGMTGRNGAATAASLTGHEGEGRSKVAGVMQLQMTIAIA
jgi:hypothetical protein